MLALSIQLKKCCVYISGKDKSVKCETKEKEK